MYVNPFWMGVLMTIVAELVISIIVSIVRGHMEEEENDEDSGKVE